MDILEYYILSLKTRKDIYNKDYNNKKYLQSFIEYLRIQFIYPFDLKNNRDIDLDSLKDSIIHLRKDLVFDTEKFLDFFNKQFNYVGYSRISKSYNRIKNKSKIVIDDLNEDTFNYFLKNNIDIALYSGLYTTDDVDNIILRYFYVKENKGISKELVKLNLKRKLSILDFNLEIIERLGIESLLYICANQILNDNIDMEYAEYILIQKTQRLDKLYVAEYTNIDSEKKFNEMVESKEIVDINILKEFNDLLEKVKVKRFREKVFVITKEIVDELNLIKCILRLNIEYLENKIGNDTLKEYIDFMLYNYRCNVPEDIIYLNMNQRCLLKQLLIGVLYNEEASKRYSSEFIELLNSIFVKLKNDRCSTYVDLDQFNVSCLHKTFSYYTMNKWMEVFCYFFTKYFNKECITSNIKQTVFDFIYPKEGFCDNCHLEYSKLKAENTDIKKDKNTVENKFIAYQNKEKLLFFRIRYADTCDTHLYSKHFTQVSNVKNASINLLEELVYSLKREVNDMILFLNKK